MFAVPGWSVSAANLKPETAANGASTQADHGGEDSQEKPASAKNPVKKRKRAGGGGEPVTGVNLSNLWESVIEGKPSKKTKRTEKGRNSKSHGEEKRGLDTAGNEARSKGDGGQAGNIDGAAGRSGQNENRTDKKSEKKKKKDKNKKSDNDKGKKDRKGEKCEKDHDDNATEGPSQDTKNEKPAGPTEPAATSSSAPTTKSNLTPLQTAMREKLVSARFRHLNETLYTRPSTEAFQLFQDSPEMFQEYHEGFRRQVNVWPENPVDGYIRDIKQRSVVRSSSSSSSFSSSFSSAADKRTSHASQGGISPLLRTNGICTIADLGCGDAKLATELQPFKKKLRLEVLSYDLQSPSPFVTRADIANLPLGDNSVNTVIFCLALMGTNWLDFIEEAYRVLHWKGELWIAEIQSRFAAPTKQGSGGKRGAPVAHSVGNMRKQKGTKAKKVKSKGDAHDDNESDGEDSRKMDAQSAAIEIDGAEDRRNETDVSAFVEALQRRGFVLQQLPSKEHDAESRDQNQNMAENVAIDLSNKMFAKMRFLKAAPATVGKMAGVWERANQAGRGQRKKNGKENVKAKTKFVDVDSPGGADGTESKILKPCVYKQR